jgi:hypothetical protein
MAHKSVLFLDQNANERGTSVATYAYAKYNEEILGNTSIILVPANAGREALDLYQGRFSEVHTFQVQDDIIAFTRNADFCYALTSGIPAPFDLNKSACRVGIHCVFTAHCPHGDVYAAVSEWVALNYALKCVPVVPHIVELSQCDQDLRAELGIPRDAVVFGRYGGYHEFNIFAVMQTIAHSLLHREDIYFLLMNTQPFFEHPRLLYLPKTLDFKRKTRFVNTCDAMIHARREGETFGLAVGEFSIRRKPVITWFWSHDRHHITTLGENGIYYRTPIELFKILTEFKKGEQRPDCYSAKYYPEKVMEQFETVFLS